MTDPDKSNLPDPIVLRIRKLYPQPFFLAATSTLALLASFCCCMLTPWFLGFQRQEGRAGANDAVARITDWTLPESFVGQQGIIIDNMLMQTDFAVFKHKQGRGYLAVAQMHSKLGPNAERHEFAQRLFEMFVPDLRKIDVRQQETLKLTIRQKTAEFEIAQGEDRASTTRYRHVTGTFQGKRDEVVLILQCEEEFMTAEEISRFLNSIH